MSEHAHGCVTCRPDSHPDYDPADARYHAFEKCGRVVAVLVDGVDVGYVVRSFEGPEGWAAVVGKDAKDVHACPNHPRTDRGPDLCETVVFGTVQVIHACPARFVGAVFAIRTLAERVY